MTGQRFQMVDIYTQNPKSVALTTRLGLAKKY